MYVATITIFTGDARTFHSEGGIRNLRVVMKPVFPNPTSLRTRVVIGDLHMGASSIDATALKAIVVFFFFHVSTNKLHGTTAAREGHVGGLSLR
jgi:hypothetical protein